MRKVHLLILCLAVAGGSAELLGDGDGEPELKEEQIIKVVEGANLLAEWAGLDLDESNKEQVLDFVKALHDISMEPELEMGAQQMIEFGLDTFFSNISENPMKDSENATESGEAEQDCKYCLSREEFTQISRMYLTLQKWFPSKKHAYANKIESAPIFYYLKKALLDRSYDEAKVILNYMFRMVRGTKNDPTRRSKSGIENNDIENENIDDCEGDEDSDREIKITLGFSKNMFAPMEPEPKYKHKSHKKHHGNRNSDHHHESSSRYKRDTTYAGERHPSVDDVINSKHHHYQHSDALGSSSELTPPRMLEPQISYLYPYSHHPSSSYDRGSGRHGDSRRSHSSSSRGHSSGHGHSSHREPEGFSRRSMGPSTDTNALPSVHHLYRPPPPRGTNNAPSPTKKNAANPIPPSYSRRSFGPSDDSAESHHRSSHHGSSHHHGDSPHDRYDSHSSSYHHRYEPYSGEDYGRRNKREIDQPMKDDGIVDLVDGLVVGRTEDESVSINATTPSPSLTENGDIQLDENENATEANTRSKRAAAAAGVKKSKASSRRSMGGKKGKSKQFSRRSMGSSSKSKPKFSRRSFGGGGKSKNKSNRRSFGSKKSRGKRSADYFSSRDFMTQYGKSYQAHLLQEASKVNSRRVIRDSSTHMADILEGADLARRPSTTKAINKRKKKLRASNTSSQQNKTVTDNATSVNITEQTKTNANDTADNAGKEEPVFKVSQQLEDTDVEKLQNSTAEEIEKLKAEKKTILRHLVEQYERETLKDLKEGLDKSEDATKIKN